MEREKENRGFIEFEHEEGKAKERCQQVQTTSITDDSL
jgi:hypothetical protein